MVFFVFGTSLLPAGGRLLTVLCDPGFGTTQAGSPFGQTAPAFSSTPLAFGQTQVRPPLDAAARQQRLHRFCSVPWDLNQQPALSVQASAPFGAAPSTGMFGSTTPVRMADTQQVVITLEGGKVFI